MNIFQTIIKKRWHLHFFVILPIAYLLSSFVEHTLGGDLGTWGRALILFFISGIIGYAWEIYWAGRAKAPVSFSDVLATALGGFVGALIFSLTVNFDVGNLFLWLATIIPLGYLGISLYKIFYEKENSWRQIKVRVIKFFVIVLLYSVVAFIHGI